MKLKKELLLVFPTQVGVIPAYFSYSLSKTSVPHTGGGDPIVPAASDKVI